MKDEYGNHRTLDYFRYLIMKHMEYGKVYDTKQILQMIKESGMYINLTSKEISLVMAPLYTYGYAEVVGFKTSHHAHYYQFVKKHDFHSTEVRVRWLPGHNDVYITEKLVDGVIVDQKLNVF